MKVLIWTQYFWPENFHINEVARILHEKGVEVTVLTGKPNYPEGAFFLGYKAFGIQREKFSGCDVIRIPIRARGKGRSKSLVLNYLSFVLSGYLFSPFALCGRKFDAVLVYAPSPLLQALPAVYLSWLKKASLIVWVQDSWPDILKTMGFIRNRWLLKCVELAVRYIYRYADSILMQSEAFRVSVQCLVKNKQKIHWYPNATNDLSKGVLLTQTKNPIIKEIQQHFSIIFAGNIGMAQSCEKIIEAAQLLVAYLEIKFYLVGGGRYLESITKKIKDRHLTNIITTGRLLSEEMPAILSAASVLLVSLCDDPTLSTTIPSKLQSYLSIGKPIITSLNGEAAKLVTQAQAGIVCPAEDAQALAMAVLQLYTMHPNERSQLGTNGYRYFKENFDLRIRVEDLIGYLQEKNIY